MSETNVIEMQQESKAYLKIKELSKRSGLPEYAIRDGVKNNKFPAIKLGNTYYVNYHLFLQILEAESKGVGGNGNQ